VRVLGLANLVRLVGHAPSFFKLFFRLVKDPRVAFRPKLVLLGALSYLILPPDLLPDLLLGLGQLDDLMVLLLGLKFFIRLCPKEVVREHVQMIAEGR
jgi:uncharacterized membrane protein YkvA (DUF1232 family)